MKATRKTREYRAFPRVMDSDPRIAHGRTEDKTERIMRPYGATPRTAKGWQ